MEPVETFVEIFRRSWESENAQALARILGDAPGYLRNVSECDRETALGMIFDKNKGLFKFIETVLGMQESHIKLFQRSLKESFYALQFIMEFFKQEYEPYIMQTKDSCFRCIKEHSLYDIKKTASETLKKLIELFNNYDMQLYDIVEHYKEESTLYIVLGAIARYCPKTENMANNADSIYFKLLLELHEQCRRPQRLQQQDDIKMYLNCLVDMMINFKPFKEYPDSDYYKKLYDVFLLLCEPSHSSEIINNTVWVLGQQMRQFSSFVFKDSEIWHNLFNIVYKNDPTHGMDALKAFYKIIPVYLVDECKEDIFLSFKNYFIAKLADVNLSSNELCLIIYGLGYFSIAYAKYSPSEINEIFQMIDYRTLSFSAKQINAENIELLPYYLQALVQILSHVPNVSLHHLDIITKLSILIVEVFPKLTERNQTSAINSLKVTFSNVYQLQQIFQRQYFDQLFYNRILWSCSHPLFIDVELQEEIQNLSEHPVCYKDSLPLWHSLLKLNDDHEHLSQKILKELVSVLFDFINNLNLSVKSQQNKSRSDVSLSLKANNEADFRYFINLADLYVEIFEEVDIVILQSHIEKLLTYFIKCSYKHPMISGFYKLIEVIFKKLNTFYNYETHFIKYTCELIPQYVLDVIQLIGGFSDELQLSCIYLIFSTPLFFVAGIRDETIPVFQTAFKIGLNNLTVMFCALETLENWKSNFKSKNLNYFCKSVIVDIEPYFAAESSLVDQFQVMSRSKEEKFRITTSYNNRSLKALQNKILFFYSTLDHDVLLNFINEKSLQTNSSWIKSNLVSTTLFLPDIHLEINFDTFIPRVIELTNNDNRRKKFSACEFLHTILTIILGKKLNYQCFNRNVFSAVLKLGCDLDNTIWNLHHPLVIQLSHYLSSKRMIESKMSQEFINSLFEGLTQEFNPSLRDYCGICLKEFVQWVIKQSRENDSSKSTNFRDIFNRIINFALHEANSKRLAAVIAFNYLYTILKGSITVINTYWLEFLYAFVKCLEKCNDIRVVSAVNNVESGIDVTKSTVNAKSLNRRRHTEFPSETLTGATIWLFNQCGVINALCREKSMELFENLCLLIPGFKSVKNFINSCGISCVNEIALKNLDKDFETITVNNTKTFLRSLDFYIWIFKKEYLTPRSVLLVENCQEENVFFEFFTKYVSKINDRNIKEITKASTNTLKEAEELNNLINTVILKIIDFTSTILTTEEEDLESILENLWTVDLNLLISRFTLCPRQIGLTSKSFQVFEPQMLENWFQLLLDNLPVPYITELQANFFIEKSDYCNNFVNIQDIINLKKDVLELKEFVQGIIILRSSRFYTLQQMHELLIEYSKTISSIFEGLRIVKMNGYVNTRTEAYVTTYLRDVLRFFLLEYQPEIIETVVDLITSDATFASSTSNDSAAPPFPYHEDFYESFKTPIYRCMLKEPSRTLRILETKLRDRPDKLLALVEALLYFAQRNHTVQSDELASEVIKKCDLYKALLAGDERRLDRFFSINSIAVELNPMGVMATEEGAGTDGHGALYKWILEEFNRAGDLERKATIIESFLICMTDETNRPNADLKFVLWSLRYGNTTDWLRNLESNDLEKSRALQCLRSLLKMLLVTKSWIVFEGVVKYAAGACGLFAGESIAEHVKSYFTSILAESIPQLLESVHAMFQDVQGYGFGPEERLDVLEYFLLPALEACRVSVIGKFYEKIRPELSSHLTLDLTETDVGERKQALVTKIGSFRLFELMFGRLTSPAKDALDALLLDRSLEVRSFGARYPEEREIARLLYCAALNCCIAVVGSNGDDERYGLIFREARENDWLVWERIIDCDRKYSFDLATPSSIQKKSINIRKTVEDLQTPIEPSFDFYFSRYDPTDIDFDKSNNPTDRRQSLSLELDELNSHECMSMITGIILHLSNSTNEDAAGRRLPEMGEEDMAVGDLPAWLLSFREAFNTDKDNVKLYLMRIVGNARKAFVPHLSSFFEDLAKAVTSYLRGNELNYVVRDVLYIFIDAKYDIRNVVEAVLAQELVEALIDRAPNANKKVYEYNVQTIESLVSMWDDRLRTPRNLEAKIRENEDLAIRVVLMLCRSSVDRENLIGNREVHRFVRSLMYKWREPTTPQVYETLGWIMSYIEEEQRDALISKDLVDLFIDMQRLNRDVCARNLYLTFVGCPSLANREELRHFMNPSLTESDERRAECYEMFLESMTDLDPAAVSSMLRSMDLAGLLRDRVLACVDVGFRIVYRLVYILESVELLPYARVIEAYARKEALLEHKKMAHGFFMHVYEKYANEEAPEGNISIESLLGLSTRVLVNGVTDPSDEIQDELLTFWKERVAYFTGTTSRLLHLFHLYSPEIHASFAQFLCLLMLDLTTKSPEDQRILYQSLAEFWYEDHEIATSSRRRGIKRKRRSSRAAPLFAPSLVGMLERAVVEQGSRMKRPDRKERLQETPAGAPAMSLDVIDRLTRSNAPAPVERAPDPSRTSLAPPSPTNRTPPSFVDTYYSKLRQEATDQRDNVKVNRRYRLGRWPDVEIAQCDVVACLDDLVRQDRAFATDLAVALVCSLSESLKDAGPGAHEEFLEMLAAFCARVMKGANDFAPAAMEIMLRIECTSFDAEDVARIAKVMGRQSLGILLLEMPTIKRNSSSYACHSQSTLGSVISQPMQHRLQLARLYRSIGQDDVVASIFRNWTLPADWDNLRRGSLAEAEDDWLTAKVEYEMACEVEVGAGKDHCLDGMFRCLRELSSWAEINEKVNAILNDDYDSVWQNPKKDELLPWIFTGQLQRTLEDLGTGRVPTSSLPDHLDDWIARQGSSLTKPHGDELCMLYLCTQRDSSLASARRCLRSSLEHAREQWIHSAEPRRRILVKLRLINELEVYLKTLASKDIVEAARELLGYWERNLPESGEEDLPGWNERVAYRLAFANVVLERLKDVAMDTENSILLDVQSASLHHRLHLGNLAIAHRNKFIARKHTLQVERTLETFDKSNSHYPHLQLSFNLAASRYKHLCGDSETDPHKKFIYYADAWQLSSNLIHLDTADTSSRVQAKLHAFDVTSKLHGAIRASGQGARLALDNDFTRSTLGIETAEEIEEKLLEYRWDTLKGACEEGSREEMAESCAKFAEYCCALSAERGDRESRVQRELVEATLSGMSLGSARAARYFPCLLGYSVYSGDERIAELFKDRCQGVPSWMFLSWQEQIMSYLSTPLMTIVLPIVERLAKDFPSAIMYSFRCVCEDHPELRTNSTIDGVYKSLFGKPKVDTFFKALCYLCQPEHYLRHNLLTLIRTTNDHETFAEALDRLLEKLFKPSEDQDIHLKGPIYKKVFDKHRNDLKKLKTTSDRDTAVARVNKLCSDLRASMHSRLRLQKAATSSQLSSYSPYLSDFTGDDVSLEIPSHHTIHKPGAAPRIARIEGQVEVVDSTSGQLKVSFLGSDARSYEFLVKVGADLRPDQRVQRLFEAANESMRQEASCRKRSLAVSTYGAQPLSRELGLVQWMAGTKSLRELAEFSMVNKLEVEAARLRYQEWMKEAADGEDGTSESGIGRRALMKYGAREVVEKMKELTGGFEWDLMRRTFVRLSPSVESFVKLRESFAKSYGTMCLVHWLSGVGDRRPERTLIDVGTGRCYGLGPGRLAFGAGADLPMPELAPFRLTAQILGLLRPFGEGDLLGGTMSRALAALRAERNPIMACARLVLQEPLDWNETLNETWRREDGRREGVRWLPKKKLAIARKKLSGAKPSDVMLEELSYVHDANDHDENQYFALYKHIVNGSEFHHTRARSFINHGMLTPEEQVLCLLDQATDMNILGRMSPKWTPFL